MISAVDFKKQISKSLSANLRTLGFKGSGFNYIMNGDAFIFTIGIQASRWGGSCCAELGIHPKEIEKIGDHFLNLKNLKYYSCELRTRLAPKSAGDKWWQYSDDQNENIGIANEIFDLVKTEALPVINLFNNNPNVLDRISVSDLENPYKNIPNKLGGMTLMTTDVRLAWALTIVYEKKNLARAKLFAQYGLSKLEANSPFFGRLDFERVQIKNGA